VTWCLQHIVREQISQYLGSRREATNETVDHGAFAPEKTPSMT